MPKRRGSSRTHGRGEGRIAGRHRRRRGTGSVRKGNAVVASFAVAAAPVIAAPLAFQARAKTVTLSIDGVARKVTTAGDTVQEVLGTRAIELGQHDVVTPSLDAPVEHGDRVNVRHGRKLELAVDGGEQQTHWVHATQVGSALDEIGREFPHAELSTPQSVPVTRSAPLDRSGLDLTVKTEKRITLVQAGVKTEEITTALTVGEALRDLGVPYDAGDKIEPGLDTPVEAGSRIRLVRLEEKTRRVKVEIPNETVVRYDDDMLEGETKVLERGRDGVRLVTYETVLADGDVRSRRKIEQTMRTKPVDRVEVHGTKTVISDSPCPSGSDAESGLTANAVTVHRAVCGRFPAVDTYYGLRPGDAGEHGSGHALDIMVYSDSGLGDAIAEWVRANHSRLGISEVIWSQRIWTAERSSEGWRWMEDRGSTTANHYDHVHVTVY